MKTTKNAAILLAVVVSLTAASFVALDGAKKPGGIDANAAAGSPPSLEVYVDDDADPGWYDATHVKTIQDGIDNASSGGIVYVHNGTYYEHVDVDKAIELRGEGGTATIVDGGGSDVVVRVRADRVNISGFRIKNSGSGWFDAGIKLRDVRHCCIENNTGIANRHFIYLSSSGACRIKNNIGAANSYYGIFLSGSHGNSIVGNRITGNAEGGVRLSSSHDTVIRDNLVVSNGCHGVYLYASSTISVVANDICNNTNEGILLHSSNGVSLSSNTVTGNAKGGIHLSSSRGNSIGRNRIARNSHNGVYLYSSNDNVIEENTVACNSYYGLYLSVSNGNAITGNTVANNTHGGIIFDGRVIPFFSGGDNIIYHNTLINNSQNAYDTRDNRWYNLTLQEGNYWDDYPGPDSDGDGIGDQPHRLHGGNRDPYPLMDPYGVEERLCTLTMACSPLEGGSLSVTPSGGVYTENTTVAVTVDPAPGYAFHRWSGDIDGTNTSVTVTMDADTSITAHFGVAAVDRPPSVSIDRPATGSVVNGTITISGSASSGSEAVRSVAVKIDDEAWQTTTGTRRWSYRWDTTATANGSHVIHARSFDGKNYSETASVTVTVNNLPVNRPPTLVITAPVDGTPITAPTFIKGEARDEDTGDAVKKIEVKIDDGNWTRADGTIKWAYPVDPAAIGDGDYTVQARAYDGTDYSGIASTTITIETEEENGMPGFECFLLCAAVFIALQLVRRRRW